MSDAMATTDPKTQTLDVPGAILGYDIRDPEAESSAPMLLMVGAPMDASGFTTLAAHFRDRTVVTYDPRGVGRSKRTDGAAWATPDEHADDLHRLISTLAPSPVEIFASSGGAVNALALVARHPEEVRTLVAHEPPAAQALPDRDQALAAVVDIHETYKRDGLGPAMAKFIALHEREGADPGRLRRPTASQPGRFRASDRGRRQAGRSDARPAHHRHQPLRARLRRITRGLDPHRRRRRSRIRGRVDLPRGLAVAEKLGTEAVIFPSHHAGFLGGEFGMQGEPDAFAATLREVLGEDG